jgi:hypothetical protein
MVDGIFAGRDHGVKLGDHNRALSNRSELTPCQFVYEVTVGIVIFLLALWFLD